MDAGIKLFGKTITMPSFSEEGGGGGGVYNKLCLSRNKVQQSTYPEGKSNPGTVTTNNTCETEKDSSYGEENQNNPSNPQNKPQLRKPDKILACPRCKSVDTKFCYYNNYNINQPRHFCKDCQRYWTAGGTMRNVPVGAGRRRSKNSLSSQSQHFVIADGALKANGGMVLSFGSKEHKTSDTSPSNLINDSSSSNLQAISTAPHFQYVNGAPWPYPWTVSPTQLVYPGFPCWGYGAHWVSPIVMTSSASTTSNTSSISAPSNNEYERSSDSGGVRKGNVWTPKTLRIDDPEEAAKSSIWSTLGFDNDKSDQGLFKVFPKESMKLTDDKNSHLFNANPASLSRSVNFQETS